MGICDKIKAELQDEIKARNEYTELADEADRAGMHDVANSLRGIAGDEARHRAILGGIINEPGRCDMPQDPNIPKIKVSDKCKAKADDLIKALLLAVEAKSIVREDREFADSSRANAVRYINAAFAGDIIEDAATGKILSYLSAAGEQIRDRKSLADVEALLKHAVDDTVVALLDFAVDCECREAKAMEAQKGAEALQVVLEGKGEADGKPRRYTEIPAALKPGDVVMIYEDPVTKAKPEGRAKLLKLIRTEEEDMQFWQVEFIEGGEKVERWVDIREVDG
jgi:rubrerythrin